MISLASSVAHVRLLAAVALVASVMAGCSPPAPPIPTAAAKIEAKPPATAPASPTPASAPAVAASPASSPPAAAAPALAASPIAAGSPAAASPVAAAPLPSPSPAAANPAAATPVVGSASPAGRIVAFHTLPDTPIGAFQQARLPGSVANDRKMLLGGIGSDLWHGPTDAPDEFWMVTDRGPNGQIAVDGQQRRTFPIPTFAPTIIKVRATGGTITILESIPILGQSGRPVTGLSNLEGIDETPFDYRAEATLPFNASGLDTEGLVRLRNGDFWLCEEYSPSLVKVDAGGKVIKRFVPEGLTLPGADYPVVEALPAIYAKRKINRGFEGLAVSPDEKTLFVALQSPLLNPDAATGNASRITRILAFDIATERPTAEYVYRFEPVAEFDTTAARPASEMKVSGLIALSTTSLVVLERTDWVAKLYRVDLAPATNILGSTWNNPATSPTLESIAASSADGPALLPKTLVIALNELAGVPDKIEGIALVDPRTLAIANDNDFDISTFDAAGNTQGPGAKSRIVLVALTAPLALP